MFNWLALPIARLRGHKAIHWGHGWLRREQGLKGFIRNAFYHLADGLFVYGHRAREIGIEQGFSPDRLFVIGNSLDYARQKVAQLVALDQLATNEGAIYPERLFLIVARPVPNASIETAVEALAHLQNPSP